MRQVRNVFEAIVKYGHDEDYSPVKEDYDATDEPAGSRQKISVMADRMARGEPLWHDEDRRDYNGLTGAVRPRD